MNTNEIDTTTEQLARNAKHLGDDAWPETKETEARDRATSNLDHDRTLIAPEDGMGRFLVSLPDGDDHQTLIVKSQSSYSGACDCDGFRYNQNPCSHLITLRFAESNLSNRDVNIPESQQYVMELANDDAKPPEKQPEPADVEEDVPSTRPPETRQCDDCGTKRTHYCDHHGDWWCENCGTHYADENAVESGPQPDGGNGFESQSIGENMSKQPVTKETQQTPTEPAQSDDAFATTMPDVEDKYAIDMGGDTYIRKAGYARLLKQQDWTVRNVEVVGAHETEWNRAKYRATIIDENGDALANSVGTAGPPEKEDMADADMHLDELAETRAWTRAASIATGEGLTAFAELPENASEVVGE